MEDDFTAAVVQASWGGINPWSVSMGPKHNAVLSACFSFLALQSGQQLERGSRGNQAVRGRERSFDHYTIHENSSLSSFLSEDLSSPVTRQVATHLEEVNPENDTAWYAISSDGSFLSLPLITEQEEGIYSCQVANEAGVAHKTFRLDVLGVFLRLVKISD